MKSKLAWLTALLFALIIQPALWHSQPLLAKVSKHTSDSGQALASVPSGLLVFNPYPPMVHPVRIGLLRRASSACFVLWDPGGFVFIDGRPVFSLKPRLVYSVNGKEIKELATGRTFPLPPDKKTYISSPRYQVWTDNRWWRGCLEIVTFGNAVNVINLLDLEEYLLGVVPAEMPASWHPEALKAQAVAARSYAWAHLGPGSKWRTKGFDLVPDVRDQAYKGLAREAPSTFKAVMMTRGLVLKDAGRVKPGFYRATVGDAYENLNIRKHTVSTAKLEGITGVKKIVGVTVKQWDINGNAVDVQVIGQSNSREVHGIKLAIMLGLATAGILDVHEEGGGWMFTYRGPGNGARGLSQHGANEFAKRGWQFHQILQQYYQDPDGRLRLDYLDHWKPVVPRVATDSDKKNDVEPPKDEE